MFNNGVKYLIGVTGKAFAGKDTYTDFLIEEFKKIGVVAIKTPLAKPLKEDYCKIRGITMEELEENKEFHRPFLQFYGDVRKFISGDELYWVNRLMDSLTDLEADIAIPSDVRYDFEEDFMDFTYQVIRESGETTIHSNHSSENGISQNRIDSVILNRDLESLRLRAQQEVETTFRFLYQSQ